MASVGANWLKVPLIHCVPLFVLGIWISFLLIQTFFNAVGTFFKAADVQRMDQLRWFNIFHAFICTGSDANNAFLPILWILNAWVLLTLDTYWDHIHCFLSVVQIPDNWMVAYHLNSIVESASLEVTISVQMKLFPKNVFFLPVFHGFRSLGMDGMCIKVKFWG